MNYQTLQVLVLYLGRRERIRLRAVSKEIRDAIEKPKSLFPLFKKLNTDDYSVVRMIINGLHKVTNSETIYYWSHMSPSNFIYYNAYGYQTFDKGKVCQMSELWPKFCELLNDLDDTDTKKLIESLSNGTRKNLTIYLHTFY